MRGDVSELGQAPLRQCAENRGPWRPSGVLPDIFRRPYLQLDLPVRISSDSPPSFLTKRYRAVACAAHATDALDIYGAADEGAAKTRPMLSCSTVEDHNPKFRVVLRRYGSRKSAFHHCRSIINSPL